jgi:hypothetical protein
MWLSQKIKEDPEAKKTLKEISKLIREYSDATKITKQKFWSMDVGMFFRPRTFAYFITVLIAMAIEASLFYIAKFELSFFQKLVESSMLISVQILVVGISLSTVVKSLDKESRFATEYLKDTCQIIKFACLTFLTVLNGYFCGLLFKNTVNEIVCIILSSFAIGGTIWCLWSLVYIIVETTKCMYPEFSTKAASTYAARKLIHVFMKKTYLAVWMRKHSELLEAEIKPLTNIRPSHECFTLRWDNESTERKYKIKMAKEVNFHFGYRDYDLNKFEKLDKLLKSNNAKLYLTPNFENNNEWGIVGSKENCDELLKSIKRGKFCKFKKDRHIEAENEFWDEHYLKLYQSLFKTVKAEDAAQFKEYLNSIESIFNAIRYIRKDRLVRKHSEPDYEKNRYLLLYSKSVEWLLEADIAEEVFSLFIEELSDSIDKQADRDIKNGDWYVLNVFKWILPKAYKLFEKHKDSSLWKERARIGRFYYYAANTLSGYSSGIEENDKLQIQLTLHIGIVHWLLTAIENKDNELIDDICEAAKKLVLPDEIMKFVPTELVAQHFILCGKYLKLLIAETPDISIEAFKSLLFDKYNRTEQNVVFSELIEFYIESRKNNLRDYLREFEHTDWKMRPLGGGGTGTPHFVFDGGDIDYTFIYLALLSISENEKVISFEFWHYNAKEKIAKFEKTAKVFNLYGFQQRKKLLEKWMDDCGDLYKQQEEQRIADAALNTEKISKYTDFFWDGYKKSNTVFKFCLKNGYYTVDDAASTKMNYTFPKDIFIDGSRDANRTTDGTEIARENDKMLVCGMLKPTQVSKEESKDIESALNIASQWLMGKGTTKENGIIVYCGETHIDGKMYENKDYIPSWKNEDEKCFRGYYKSYPILKIRSEDTEKCVALNLKGWKGIHIRPEVIKDNFGNLTVREWKEDEINKSISEEKIKEEDRNKVKGQCLVEYELFWKLDKDNLPEQITIPMTKETEDKGT